MNPPPPSSPVHGDATPQASLLRPAACSAVEAAAAARASEAIDRREIHTVFQPLVHLPSGELVGYEALARGPEHSLVESPLALLAAARTCGRLAELDWLCAASSYAAARAAGLNASMSVFMNFEPSTLSTPCPADLLPFARHAQDELRVFVEVTEESIVDDPGTALDALERVREIGWGVAIGNAAASPSSLALFPLIEPDVVKLDLRSVRDDPEMLGQMSDGARLYAEQTGVPLLMQGLEVADDIQVARAAGAEYGQGWFLGHPVELARSTSVPRAVFPLVPRREFVDCAPFDLIRRHVPTSVADRRFIQPLADYLLHQSDRNGQLALSIVNLERRLHPDAEYVAALAAIHARSAFGVLAGVGLAGEHGVHSRVAHNGVDNPLADDWIVVSLGPHYVGALVARDLGDGGAAVEHRRYEYALTHDRDLVLRLVRSLLRRLDTRSKER